LLFLLRRNVETKTQSECKTHFNDFSHKSLSADDRLIKLVRANPAIYDVSHPHYRRNPVRVDIWDRIANELGASCEYFLLKPLRRLS